MPSPFLSPKRYPQMCSRASTLPSTRLRALCRLDRNPSHPPIPATPAASFLHAHTRAVAPSPPSSTLRLTYPPSHTSAPDQLFFVHLPSALPVRPSAPKPPGAPPTVSGTEYIAALARGDGCEEGGVCGFGVGGGSFRGGGAAEGSPPLATLEDMEAGTQGELLVYKSGKVVWSLHGFLLELQQGAPCSFDQEIVALRQPPDADGGEGALVTVGAPTGKASAVPMHLYRLGRMAHRLVVTPDVPSLLQRCAAERAAGI